MSYQSVARDLLAILAGLQGLAIVAINLNRNHARNSEWTGHARFHVVWQAWSFAALAAFEIMLLFPGGPSAAQRFYFAAALTGIPMFAFFIACLGHGRYGGMLADAHGAPPISVRMFGSLRLIDLNLAAEIVGMLSLIAVILLFSHS